MRSQMRPTVLGRTRECQHQSHLGFGKMVGRWSFSSQPLASSGFYLFSPSSIQQIFLQYLLSFFFNALKNTAINKTPTLQPIGENRQLNMHLQPRVILREHISRKSNLVPEVREKFSSEQLSRLWARSFQAEETAYAKTLRSERAWSIQGSEKCSSWLRNKVGGGERNRDFEMRQKIQERMCEEPCEPWAGSIILHTIGAQQRALNRSTEWQVRFVLQKYYFGFCVENWLEPGSPSR